MPTTNTEIAFVHTLVRMFGNFHGPTISSRPLREDPVARKHHSPPYTDTARSSTTACASSRRCQSGRTGRSVARYWPVGGNATSARLLGSLMTSGMATSSTWPRNGSRGREPRNTMPPGWQWRSTGNTSLRNSHVFDDEDSLTAAVVASQAYSRQGSPPRGFVQYRAGAEHGSEPQMPI